MSTSPCILMQYEPLIVACNVSTYRVEAVLSHKLGEEECPIAYTSPSLVLKGTTHR